MKIWKRRKKPPIFKQLVNKKLRIPLHSTKASIPIFLASHRKREQAQKHVGLTEQSSTPACVGCVQFVMVLTVSCLHTGLFHSKSRYLDALLPPFPLATRTHSKSLIYYGRWLAFQNPCFYFWILLRTRQYWQRKCPLTLKKLKCIFLLRADLTGCSSRLSITGSTTNPSCQRPRWAGDGSQNVLQRKQPGCPTGTRRSHPLPWRRESNWQKSQHPNIRASPG